MDRSELLDRLIEKKARRREKELQDKEREDFERNNELVSRLKVDKDEYRRLIEEAKSFFNAHKDIILERMRRHREQYGGLEESKS